MSGTAGIDSVQDADVQIVPKKDAHGNLIIQVFVTARSATYAAGKYGPFNKYCNGCLKLSGTVEFLEDAKEPHNVDKKSRKHDKSEPE
jgi:hypothetical protein